MGYHRVQNDGGSALMFRNEVGDLFGVFLKTFKILTPLS